MRRLAVLFSSCIIALSADAASSRPNILLIVADDLGYGELSCQGGDIPTPNIDSIATNGVRFTSGYVTAPFCAASRAAMMTGRYQTRFGFEFNPIGPKNADPAIGLPVKETTLADRLRATGYATGLVGKWHLGGTAAYHPARRGFDEFFGFLHEGHYYVPPPWKGTTTWLRRKALPDGGEGRWTSPDGRIVWSTHMGGNEPDYDADNPLLRMSQPVEERKNLTEAFGREAEDFIRRHASQPFFLYLAYNAVHSPLQAEDKYLKKFEHIGDIQRRIFAAMLAHLDDSVGDVLKRVQKEGLEDNTLIFFLSDNGGPTKELTSRNAPLRGGKGELWDGGIRVPFLMQWKGRLPAGKVIDQPVISTDIAATALALAQSSHLAPRDEPNVSPDKKASETTRPAGFSEAVRSSRRSETATSDGIDLLPHLTAARVSLPERPLYWRVGNKGALRRGDWKVVRNAGKGASAAWQLYDVASDIGEENDLADQQAKKLDELVAEWERLNKGMVEAAW